MELMTMKQVIYAELDLYLLETQARRSIDMVKNAHTALSNIIIELDDLWKDQKPSHAKSQSLRAIETARVRLGRVEFKPASVYSDSQHLDKARCDLKKCIMGLERVM